MFKNRVRTAALAGAIAVATGVSGVAVPAFAEDTTATNIQGGGFNEPDASLAKDVKAENVTEDQLLKLVGATHHYIINNNRNILRLFPCLQYIIQVRKVNRGYAEESLFHSA